MEKNIVSGYEDGTVKPDKNISRAELTTIVVKAMGLKPSDKPVLDFADKDKIPTWAAGYIALANEKGIILGFEDKTFRPDKNCSRQEATAIIMRAFNIGESDNELKFKDTKDISGWAYKFIAKSTESKIYQWISGQHIYAWQEYNQSRNIYCIIQVFEYKMIKMLN
jgi:endo-1,4-beta-xylanase